MEHSALGWFAVYTKPRQEQLAQVNLEQQSFECFLPMARNPYQRRSNKRNSRPEPLFPRYLFLNARPKVQNLAAVRSTRGTVDFVRTGVELTRVPESIIEALKSRVRPETGLIDLEPDRLNKGERVRVLDGPFAGREAVFQEHRGETRSILLLNMLSVESTLEVDSMQIQRIA